MVFPSVQILPKVTRARLGDNLKSYKLILTQISCPNKPDPNEPMAMKSSQCGHKKAIQYQIWPSPLCHRHTYLADLLAVKNVKVVPV